jgi:hypothetical protein
MNAIYVDERLGTDTGGFYFLGGIAVDDHARSEIAHFIRTLKLRLMPDIDPHHWYLKADGKHLAGGQVAEDSKDQAFARWEAFSELLPYLENTAYSIHTVTILQTPFRRRPELVGLRHEQQVEREMTVAIGTLLMTLMFKGGQDWAVVTDSVDGRALTAFQAGTQFVRELGESGQSPVKVASVEIVPKTDLCSDDSRVLQFVDSVIYALSRFIIPAGARKSILAEFERWPLNHVRGIESSEQEVLRDSLQYFRIAPLYHHLRWKFLKNILTRNGQYSSAILVSETEDWNFGSSVDRGIWKLCNTMWPGWSEDQLLLDLCEHLAVTTK